MCRSMVDIQSEAAEIRRGKKKKKKIDRRKETTGQKYNGPPITEGGHNKHGCFNVTGSTMPIFVIEIVIDFSARAVLVLKKI